jgi:hypothetical protein
MIKERPILFSGPMVRAILEGRKTQTRRIVTHKKQLPPEWATFAQEITSLIHGKPGWHPIGLFQWSEEQLENGPLKPLRRWPYRDLEDAVYNNFAVQCPYGGPGDRLWVRETSLPDFPKEFSYYDWSWREVPNQYRKPKYCIYRADHPDWNDIKWHPSIHMPRWASRILLEITKVRVERLQNMEGVHPKESDALAEGINAIHHGDGDYYYSAFRDSPSGHNWIDPADAFKELWETINGKGSWESNPWVWVIEFKRIKP